MIQAYESAPLFAKLSGFVKIVRVDIGDVVEGLQMDAKGVITKPGTVLAEISIPELEDESREKEALVDKAKAEVEQAKKQIVIAEANVDTAGAQVIEAMAGVRRAAATLKRWESEAVRVAEMVNKDARSANGRRDAESVEGIEAAAEEAGPA